MKVNPIPEIYKNVIPFLICSNTDKVIEFCQKVFDAKLSDISRKEDGKVAHAAIHIRDSAVMLSEESDNYPKKSAMLYIYVDDVDAIYKKGIDAGGVSLREPTNEFYGDRSCGFSDCSGNQWWIASHIEDVSTEEMDRRQKASRK